MGHDGVHPVILFVLVIAVLGFLVFGVYDECGGGGDARAKKAVEAAGVEDVEIEGRLWWSGCGEDDGIGRSFSGTRGGKPVSGVVCCPGYGRGCLLRW